MLPLSLPPLSDVARVVIHWTRRCRRCCSLPLPPCRCRRSPPSLPLLLLPKPPSTEASVDCAVMAAAEAAHSKHQPLPLRLSLLLPPAALWEGKGPLSQGDTGQFSSAPPSRRWSGPSRRRRHSLGHPLNLPPGKWRRCVGHARPLPPPLSHAAATAADHCRHTLNSVATVGSGGAWDWVHPSRVSRNPCGSLPDRPQGRFGAQSREAHMPGTARLPLTPCLGGGAGSWPG